MKSFSVSQIVAVTLALLAPAMVQGVENCRAGGRGDGTIVVSASKVVGKLRWGTARGNETNSFFNGAKCVRNRKASKCVLGDRGSASRTTLPNAQCRIYLADDGPVGCDTFINGCVVRKTSSVAAITATTQAAREVADTTPPMLVSIAVSPTSVDVSTGSTDITVTLHLTDDSSGVASWSTTFVSPSGLQSLAIEASPGLVNGTLTDGIFSGSKTLPQGSEQGAWTASTLTVTDVAGNTANISLSTFGIFLIQVGPSKEDATPPDLMSIEVTPTTVDVTAGDATVIVSAHLTDDLSGAQFFYGDFRSPSGRHDASFGYGYLASGTSLDGVFQATAFFPQYTEPGVWRPQNCYESIPDPPGYRLFPCVQVSDRVGNVAQIDLQALGTPLQLGVLSVKPGATLTLA